MKNPLRLINKRTLIIMLSVILALTLLVLIIIIVTSVSPAAPVRWEHPPAEFGLDDFYSDLREPESAFMYPARTPQRFWTRSEVDDFWIDPSEAETGRLSEKNDEMIYGLLGVPLPETAE